MKKRQSTSLLTITIGLFILTISINPASAKDLRDWGTKINKASSRFKVLKGFNNEAVLDRETQLVWERSPGDENRDGVVENDDRRPASSARSSCLRKTTGERMGWRLPSVYELASLIDPNDTNPDDGVLSLPNGHPFQNIAVRAYWSSTIRAIDPSQAFTVNFNDTGITPEDQIDVFFLWCVRGGSPGADTQ